MSSCLVGAFEFFFWLYLDTKSKMRRWDGTISLKHGTRFWSEMIFCWVYQDFNTIFIMKRNDWSTNSNSSSEGRYTFFFWVLFGCRILYCRAKSDWHTRVPTVRWFFTGCIKAETLFSIRKGMIDKPRPWWHWVRKDGVHFFAGHSDTLTESIVYPDRKCESSFRRPLIAATQL